MSKTIVNSSKYDEKYFTIEFKRISVLNINECYSTWCCCIESKNDEEHHHPHFSAEIYNDDKRTAFDKAVEKIERDIKDWIKDITSDFGFITYRVENNELWEPREIGYSHVSKKSNELLKAVKWEAD